MAYEAANLPAGERTVDRVFPADRDCVGDARAFVGDWLREWAAADDTLIADVTLAVSEACTNAVIHAYRDPASSATGTFRVVGERDGAAARVTVTDAGCGMLPRLDSDGLGYGLALIASVADGLDISPPRDGSGTIVAMRFDTDRPRRRAQ